MGVSNRNISEAKACMKAAIDRFKASGRMIDRDIALEAYAEYQAVGGRRHQRYLDMILDTPEGEKEFAMTRDAMLELRRIVGLIRERERSTNFYPIAHTTGIGVNGGTATIDCGYLDGKTLPLAEIIARDAEIKRYLRKYGATIEIARSKDFRSAEVYCVKIHFKEGTFLI